MNWYSKQYSEKQFEKANDAYLSSGIDIDILEIKKFFNLIIFMGIIYKSNIVKHRFTDSLYYTPTFQKL